MRQVLKVGQNLKAAHRADMMFRSVDSAERIWKQDEQYISPEIIRHLSGCIVKSTQKGAELTAFIYLAYTCARPRIELELPLLDGFRLWRCLRRIRKNREML